MNPSESSYFGCFCKSGFVRIRDWQIRIFKDSFCVIQWTPLNGITLGQTISDPFNRMIPITEHMSNKRMLLKGIRDLINLSHFDPIIRMIPLSGAHCSTKDL
jgi:hypothetical protein